MYFPKCFPNKKNPWSFQPPRWCPTLRVLIGSTPRHGTTGSSDHIGHAFPTDNLFTLVTWSLGRGLWASKTKPLCKICSQVKKGPKMEVTLADCSFSFNATSSTPILERRKRNKCSEMLTNSKSSSQMKCASRNVASKKRATPPLQADCSDGSSK